MKYRAILLFGAPGAGKGTQGKILGTIPNFFHCACGDVFRSLKTDSAIGQIFLEYSSRGELVPDETTIELWNDFIHSSTKTHRFHPDNDTLVLDGIPRNAHQAEMLNETLDVKSIFYLRCMKTDNLIEAGLRHMVTEHSVASLGAGLGVGEDSPDFRITLGLQYEFH